MEVDAAVVHEEGGAFAVQTVELDGPLGDEVLVEVTAAGLCHTDLSVRDQYYPTPLPAVLGHEGSGIVREVGADVTGVEPGDPVVLSFDYDDTCSSCNHGDVAYCEDFFAYNFAGRRPDDGTSPLSSDGDAVSGRFFGQSSFATHAIATERNVVPVPEDAPLELLGPLGCGIQTGAGGVINSLDPRTGSSIVIFGSGSVGLSALLGANLKGCAEKVVVDLRDTRLETAADLGATGTINASDVDDVTEAIEEHLGGGADYTFEATGDPDALRTAVDSLRQGGTCGVVGAPPMGTEVSLDVNTVLFGRTVRGIIEGDAHPKEFIPDLVDLHARGEFPFDEFVTFYDFENIQQAAEDSEDGEVIKPILRM
jgi:aryl-alcohol dehydrogenase